MPNIFLIRLENRIALIVISIAIIAFLIVVGRSFITFNKFIDQQNARFQQLEQYEKIRQ